MKRLASSFFVVALSLLSACASEQEIAPPPPMAPQPVEKPLGVEIDAGGAERIKTDVTYLASPELGGRGTGEHGAELASQFIAKRFAELHLAPLGDSTTFLQGFEARTGVKATPPIVRRAGAKGDAPPDPHVVTADGSSSGTVHGAPIFVGYGVSAPALGWDDYAKADVKGKIAVVLGGAPTPPSIGDRLKDFGSIRYKLRTAREHGAVGVVVVAKKGAAPPELTDASDMRVGGVVMSIAEANAALAPTVAAEASRRRAVAAAKTDEQRAKAEIGLFDDQKLWDAKEPGAPKPLSKDEIEITTHVMPVSARTWNVVGLLPARVDSKTANEYVVVGAHYDHLGHGGTHASRAPGSHLIHPGADDNASGVALMLEVARQLALLPRQLDRSVIFIAFGGEEIGLIGSRYFVEHAPVPVASIDAMINADMVGRLRGDAMVLDGVGTATAWPAIVEHANHGLSLHLQEGTDGFGASDHTSFTVAKVPIAFLFTGVHDDYHKPSDTADKINAEGEERIATLAARIALEVAEGPRLAFVEPKPDPHRGVGGGFKVSLGTLPDYAFAGKGVRLTGTRPDSPAARAGILGGDVVVKLGGHEIGNLHDYMFSLGELEAGREVEVVVERGGKPITLKIIPSPPH